jgi:hypothetical protein
MELQIPQAAVDRFRSSMPEILAVFRDLGMDQVDIGGYGSVVAAQRQQRAFDKYLAGPFLEAVERGTAECYEANRAHIEASDPGRQRSLRRELRRRWLVAVIKHTPGPLQTLVRQAEFENAMELRVSKAIADSRNSTLASPATTTTLAYTEQSGTRPFQGIPTGSADATPAPFSRAETERLVSEALSAGDQHLVEAAFAKLWGTTWNISICARDAQVDRGTVRHMIRGAKIRDEKRMQIVGAFHKRRLRLQPTELPTPE